MTDVACMRMYAHIHMHTCDKYRDLLLLGYKYLHTWEECIVGDNTNKSNSIPLTMRVKTEVKSKFAGIAERSGKTQPELLETLLGLYEKQEAEQLHPGRADEIEAMRRHTEAIMTHYMSALALADGAEDAVKNEYTGMINSQLQTIAELQAKVKELENAITEKEKEIAELNEQIVALGEERRKAEQTIADRDATIASLRDNRQMLEKFHNLLVRDNNGVLAVAPVLFESDSKDSSRAS